MVYLYSFPLDRPTFFKYLSFVQPIENRLDFLLNCNYDMKNDPHPEEILQMFYNDIGVTNDPILAAGYALRLALILKDRIDDIIICDQSMTIIDMMPFICFCDIECNPCEGCKYNCEYETRCVNNNFSHDGVTLVRNVMINLGFERYDFNNERHIECNKKFTNKVIQMIDARFKRIND